MRSVEFTVLGMPITQGSKSAQIRGKRIKVGNANAIIEPRVALIDQTNMATKTLGAHRLTKWRDLVAAVGKEHMKSDPPWPGPIAMSVEFVLPRPGSHYTKVGKALTKGAPVRHVSKPDVHKLARAVEDALSGVVYGDDSQLVEVTASKRYARRGGYAGAIVKVRRL